MCQPGSNEAAGSDLTSHVLCAKIIHKGIQNEGSNVSCFRQLQHGYWLSASGECFQNPTVLANASCNQWQRLWEEDDQRDTSSMDT